MPTSQDKKPQNETYPVSTSTLRFQPPKPCDNKFLLCEAPSLWYFEWHPEQTNVCPFLGKALPGLSESQLLSSQHALELGLSHFARTALLLITLFFSAIFNVSLPAGASPPELTRAIVFPILKMPSLHPLFLYISRWCHSSRSHPVSWKISLPSCLSFPTSSFLSSSCQKGLISTMIYLSI